MKKAKRILALAGAVLLVCMYACTLIFALMGSPASTGLFKASVAATILVPVLLYAYILVARLLKGSGSDEAAAAPPDASGALLLLTSLTPGQSESLRSFSGSS